MEIIIGKKKLQQLNASSETLIRGGFGTWGKPG